MPAISTFYGIIIRMLAEKGTRHHTPHFHAVYQGKDAAFDFEGNTIIGDLPDKQTTLIKAWTVLHKEELEAEWNLLNEGEKSFWIDPLK